MIVADTADFTVTSWGNGWAYAITNKARKTELFVQDDDATSFRTCWEAYELAYPDMDTNAILAMIYADYEPAFAPIGWTYA